MIQFEKLGIYVSKPLALLLFLTYLLQSALALYLVNEKFKLEKQINYQQNRINELEEKLQLYKAIEDFEIGFTDDEIGELTKVIYRESTKYGYDPLFVVSVILTESSFKRDQVSHKGAQGLMQVKPLTGAAIAPRAGVDWYGPETLAESESNIKLGTYLLFELLLKYQDVKKALVAYNYGETRMRSYLAENRPLPREYFQKVMDTYRSLKEAYRT